MSGGSETLADNRIEAVKPVIFKTMDWLGPVAAGACLKCINKNKKIITVLILMIRCVYYVFEEKRIRSSKKFILSNNILIEGGV